MKQPCNIIKDLLILYEDDMCSKESKEMIETHLKDCKECHAYFQKLQCTNEIMTDEIEEIKEELHIEETVMKSGFKKIRKRWILSMVAVFMLLPAIGIGILGYHEVNNDGMSNGIAFEMFVSSTPYSFANKSYINSFTYFLSFTSPYVQPFNAFFNSYFLFFF